MILIVYSISLSRKHIIIFFSLSLLLNLTIYSFSLSLHSLSFFLYLFAEDIDTNGEVAYKAKIAEVHKFIAFRRFPNTLSQSIVAHFEFLWHEEKILGMYVVQVLFILYHTYQYCSVPHSLHFFNNKCA
jgi:hypothetical protein